MSDKTCKLCGHEHDYKCPLIKAFEYYPETEDGKAGSLKRTEFLTPADMLQLKQDDLLVLPTHSTRQ